MLIIYTVTDICASDTIMVAVRMKRDRGIVNSVFPLLMKYVCIAKAKMPPALRMSENRNPAAVCRYTSTSPKSMIKRSGK